MEGRIGEGAAEVAQRIAALVERARAERPSLALDTTGFAAHVARLVHADESLGDELDHLHAGDLALAFGCLAGDRAALTMFDIEFLSGVPTQVRRIDPTPAFADEIRQQLAQRLLVPADGQPGRLAGYTGRGPLLAWLGVAAQRAALNVVRKTQREVPLEEEVAVTLSSGAGPEVELLRERYRELFQEGLRQGLQSLTARDRTLIRMNLMAGVSMQTMATSYGVNVSTVSRWIASAREQILREMQEFLRTHVPPAELASIVRVVRSQVDIAMSASGTWQD